MKKILTVTVMMAMLCTLRGEEKSYRMIYEGERTRLFCDGKEVGFAACLREQLKSYPEMEADDVLKIICQSSYGSAHALKNRAGAYRRFRREFAEVNPEKGAIFEIISPDICRVNMRAWKYAGMPEKWLFNMFIATAENFSGGDDIFQAYLLQAEKILAPEKYARLTESLRRHGNNAPHHSGKYRKLYTPSYRIVSTRFISVLPVLAAALRVPEKPVRVIAIDGRAASGKSTLARQLAQIMEAGVVHMDDFFLPPALRSAERLSQPGGNVHYERFSTEVLPFLRSGKDFTYRIFDCKRQDFYGKGKVAASAWLIVEGAYSLHPVFQNYADLKLFFDIAPDEQLRRIAKRNGEAAKKIFAARWIPLEENHIRQNRVIERADLILGR